MRGILLAGGTGSRLRPLTDVTNKHLLPVYDKPMILWSLGCLLENGIREVCIVSGVEHLGAVVRVLGSGSRFGASFTYRVQDEAGGIAHALLQAEDFGRLDDVAVMLGDNLFAPVPKIADDWERVPVDGALIYATAVPNPSAYGVVGFWGPGDVGPGRGATLRGLHRVAGIVEKPEAPASAWIATGLYVYPVGVFHIARQLQPSGRGELEVTDLNNAYAQSDVGLWAERYAGFWGDCGTPDGILDASIALRQQRRLT